MPCGTGVCISVGNQRFIITAAHVFEHAQSDRSISAIAGKHFVELSVKYWRTRPAPHSGLPDPADLAIVPVDHAPASDGLRFLSLDELDPAVRQEERAPGTAFMAIGFPQSKQPKIIKKAAYSAFAHHFFTHFEPVENYPTLSLSADYHIAVGYDVKDFVSGPDISQMPQPHGMSGGGLWRVPRALSGTPGVPRLVGILTDYHAAPHHLVVATRIVYPLRALAHFVPNTRVTLSDAFPGILERAV